MSNLTDSQNESLGEVRQHFFNEIRATTESNVNYSRVEGSGPVVSDREYSNAEAVPNEVLTSERLVDECTDECTDEGTEVGYDPEPRAISSGSNYRITIEKQNYGFIVKIGCQTFAIEKPETIGTMITTFLSNSSEAEKAWYNTSGNNRLEETLQQFK